MAAPPALTELSEAARAAALARYSLVLRPHLEEGAPLASAATAAGVGLAGVLVLLLGRVGSRSRR